MFRLNLNRHPDPAGELPQDSIKVDVQEDGYSGTVIIDPKTNTAQIQMPDGLDEEGMEEWKRKIGDGKKLLALANKKNAEINKLYTEKDKEIQQKLAEAEAIRQKALQDQQKWEAAVAKLENKDSSNLPAVKEMHEFMGLHSADDLSDFIANNPGEFATLQAKYIAEVSATAAKHAIESTRATDHSKSQQEAIRQKATQEGIDYSDFALFCANMKAEPNDYALTTYKTLQSGPRTPTQNIFADVEKYNIEILPPGGRTTGLFEQAIKNPKLQDTFSETQMAEYMAWLKKQQPSG